VTARLPAGRGRRGAERGTGRTSPTTPGPGITQASRASGDRRTGQDCATTHGQGYASERRSRERGAVHVPTLAQDQDDDHGQAFALPANAVLLLEPGSDIGKEPRPFQIWSAFAQGRPFFLRKYANIDHFLPNRDQIWSTEPYRRSGRFDRQFDTAWHAKTGNGRAYRHRHSPPREPCVVRRHDGA
jgi:hypothetical protein